MAFWLLIAIFLGLIFWSFGSVIISRRHKSETLQEASSILRWRSECPQCKHPLQAIDLIPLFSFLFQKGRCRYCKTKISRIYPILELGSALIFWLLWRYLQGESIGIILFWTFSSWALRLILVYDVLRYELHTGVLVLAGIFLLAGISFQIISWKVVLGWAILLVIFRWLYLFAKIWVQHRYKSNEEGVGMGDVLLAPYLGSLIFVALQNINQRHIKVLILLFFLVISGIIWIIRYFIQNQYYKKKADFLPEEMAAQSLPFLPSMIIAAGIVIIFQDFLVHLIMGI